MTSIKHQAVAWHTLGDTLPSVKDESGLWQPDWGRSVDERRSVIAYAADGSTHIGSLAVGQYQDWAELDWKEQHGSRAMLGRLSRKFMEEAGDIDHSEVLSAHLDVLRNPGSVPHQEHLLDELGDAVWAGSGLFSNGGYDLEQATLQRLIAQNQPVSPAEPLTLDTLDGLYEDGFRPLVGVKQSIVSEEIRNVAKYMDAKICWPLIAQMLNNLAAMQFENEPVVLGATAQYENLLARYGADSLLFAGYMAHESGNGTLKDVIANNVRKVTQRVTTNTIDKADGVRSE